LPDSPQATLDRLYYGIRKGAHVAEYGLLAVLAQSAWRVRLPTVPARFGAALAWVVAVAAFDEGRQSFSDRRTGSLEDVALDFAGGVLALCVVIAYLGAMRRRRSARERL
jgi:VanZ family protein